MARGTSSVTPDEKGHRRFCQFYTTVVHDAASAYPAGEIRFWSFRSNCLISDESPAQRQILRGSLVMMTCIDPISGCLPPVGQSLLQRVDERRQNRILSTEGNEGFKCHTVRGAICRADSMTNRKWLKRPRECMEAADE